MVPVLIPELHVADPSGAEERLCRHFGFAPERPGRLRLGGQTVAIAQAEGPLGHGLIDHLALAVEDADRALRDCLARGARLADVTPAGPLDIPEFWSAGVRYVFLDGPEGARVELCARPGVARPGLPGHDHIGLACRDLPEMRRFFLSLGLRDVAATTLIRPGGNIDVCFLQIGDSVVELYAPPDLPPGPRPTGFWRRLVLEGASGAGPVSGPEGIEVLRAAQV